MPSKPASDPDPEEMHPVAEMWKSLLDRPDVLILDTETTGIDNHAELVEISLIDTTGAVVYNDLVMPDGRIPADASAIHGLTRETLAQAGAKPWSQHQERVVELLRSAAVLCGYNLPFDVRMLEQTIRRYAGSQRFAFNLAEHCIMRTYAKWDGTPHPFRSGLLKWWKLEEAVENEGGTAVQEHRSLSDCKMTLELMRAVVANARTSKRFKIGRDAELGPFSKSQFYRRLRS